MSVIDPYPERNTLAYSEAAQLIGCDWRTVKRAAQNGQVKVIVLGERVLVLKQPLLDMLTNGQDLVWPA